MVLATIRRRLELALNNITDHSSRGIVRHPIAAPLWPALEAFCHLSVPAHHSPSSMANVRFHVFLSVPLSRLPSLCRSHPPVACRPFSRLLVLRPSLSVLLASFSVPRLSPPAPVCWFPTSFVKARRPSVALCSIPVAVRTRLSLSASQSLSVPACRLAPVVRLTLAPSVCSGLLVRPRLSGVTGDVDRPVCAPLRPSGSRFVEESSPPAEPPAATWPPLAGTVTAGR